MHTLRTLRSPRRSTRVAGLFFLTNNHKSLFLDDDVTDSTHIPSANLARKFSFRSSMLSMQAGARRSPGTHRCFPGGSSPTCLRLRNQDARTVAASWPDTTPEPLPH